MKTNKKLLIMVMLHMLILFGSLSGILSKLAGCEEFPSLPFFLYYGGVLLIMVIYALCWQQIIKHLPLTTAYSSKAVGMVWSVLWGVLLFREHINLRMLFGMIVIVAGACIVVSADE